MSMVTTIKVKKTGKKDKFLTQQYVCGLYVAIYHEGDPLPEQLGHKEDNEKKFHEQLREAIDKKKATLITEESTVL